MQFLLWNILFSSLFILCVKWVQNRDSTDVVTVGCINYVVAAVASLPAFLQSDPSPAAHYAAIFGGTMGSCYFVAFFFLIYAVHWVGVANSAAVSRLALIVPIAAGIVYWGEQPNSIQLTGIAVAMASLLVVGKAAKEYKSEATQAPTILLKLFVLGTFFAICGGIRLSQQACKKLSDGVADYPTFLFYAFLLSGIPAIVVLLWRQRAISRIEIIAGIVLGVTNILQSHFILRSLDAYSSVIVFPVTSSGGLLFTTLVAFYFLGEKMNRSSWIGVSMAIVSIVLLQG